MLLDPERRAIYDGGGLAALRQAEAFQEESVFDADPYGVYDVRAEGLGARS